MFIMFLFCFFFFLSKLTLLLSAPVNPVNSLSGQWKVLTLCVLSSLESHRQYSDF